VDPVRYQKAVALVETLEPDDSTIATAMALLDRQFVPTILQNPDVKQLETQHPGIVAAMWDGARPLMRTYLLRTLPRERQWRATLFATELTRDELDSVAAFLTGPVGKRFVALSMQHLDVSRDILNGVEGKKTTVGQVSQSLQSASMKGIGEMTEAERQAFIAFAESPGGKALARIAPKVSEQTAKWMNVEDPELEREVSKAMAAAVEKFLSTHPPPATR
jgi:hypothetical protein